MRVHARKPPARHRRALAAALAASALLVGAAACSDEGEPDALTDGETGSGGPGEFAATAAYLSQAADKSVAEGYRTELRFSMSDEADDDSPLMASGTIEGDAFHMEMDLGPMMSEIAGSVGEPMPPEMAGLDLTMELAGDADRFYLHAPMLATLGGGSGVAGDLAAIGDGWGFVDMAALGDQAPTDVASALGAQSVDPQAVVEMIQGADGVEELGSAEVRGTAVQGLSAEVTMGELMEASGQDPEAIGTTAAEAVFDTPAEIEVWIDDDGYLRRMAFGYDMADVADAMGEDTDGLGVANLQFSYMMDMFDYGATVDFEAPADAVDITDAYVELLQQ
jgi:hypothetical protein